MKNEYSYSITLPTLSTPTFCTDTLDPRYFSVSLKETTSKELLDNSLTVSVDVDQATIKIYTSSIFDSKLEYTYEVMFILPNGAYSSMQIEIQDQSSTNSPCEICDPIYMTVTAISNVGLLSYSIGDDALVASLAQSFTVEPDFCALTFSAQMNPALPTADPNAIQLIDAADLKLLAVQVDASQVGQTGAGYDQSLVSGGTPVSYTVTVTATYTSTSAVSTQFNANG